MRFKLLLNKANKKWSSIISSDVSLVDIETPLLRDTLAKHVKCLAKLMSIEANMYKTQEKKTTVEQKVEEARVDKTYRFAYACAPVFTEPCCVVEACPFAYVVSHNNPNGSEQRARVDLLFTMLTNRQ
jgi:hypothetical protein